MVKLISKQHNQQGFTLIEVLLALAIVAIAFTALLKATSQDIVGEQHVKNKTISHWIAIQGMQLVQLGLVTMSGGQDISEVTTLFNEKWYWRAHIESTPLKSVQKIIITVSQHQAGPFSEGTTAYRFNP